MGEAAAHLRQSHAVGAKLVLLVGPSTPSFQDIAMQGHVWFHPTTGAETTLGISRSAHQPQKMSGLGWEHPPNPIRMRAIVRIHEQDCRIRQPPALGFVFRLSPSTGWGRPVGRFQMRRAGRIPHHHKRALTKAKAARPRARAGCSEIVASPYRGSPLASLIGITSLRTISMPPGFLQ